MVDLYEYSTPELVRLLNELVEMIHHYCRVYEQEGYIENCTKAPKV